MLLEHSVCVGGGLLKQPGAADQPETSDPSRDMLCPSVFQPPPVPIRTLLDLHWPVRSLWPQTRPLVYHVEQEMIRHMQEMRQNMEFMERLHQKLFEEMDATSSSSSSSSSSLQPIGFRELGTGDGSFVLSLDTQDFSPQELWVRQVGRKLRVSGRTERKQEDGRGSYSYRCQEFRQELDLPKGVDPETVTCSLVGGRLQIHAPREGPPADGKERIVPISLASAPAVTSSDASSSSGGLEGSAPPSESSAAE